MWTKSISGMRGFGISEYSESDRIDYIVSGGIGSTQERWVARINGDNGSILWSKTYPYNGSAQQFDGVRMTMTGSDGYIYGAGFVGGDESGTIFVVYGGQSMLMKIDPATGDEIWTHTNINSEYALTVIQDSNADLYYGATMYESDLSLTKLNTDGMVCWTRFIPNTTDVIPADLAITNSDQIYFGCHTGRDGVGEPFDYTCIKLDTEANMSWIKHFANPRGYSLDYIRNELYGIKVNDEAIYMFGGSGDESESYSETIMPYSSSDVWNGWVLITDLDGNILRSDIFCHDNANTATEYGDIFEDGYVIFNDTDAMGDTEVGVMKIDHGDLIEDSMEARSYYVDGVSGSDSNDGTISTPWKSLTKVSSTIFNPGDNIYFKRGTSYDGTATINGDGEEGFPITIGAYDNGYAPKFTNPNYALNSGNAMQIRGDYQIVENLHFHHTAPAPPEASSFGEVWTVGALHISLGNDNVVVRNNEFANVPKAIQSYSQYSLITGNYIHDSNTDQENGFLQDPYWGPIAIQLGIGNQEIANNRIENMYAVGGEFGADGGAIEIDDGRNHKDNIHIHHNHTLHNMGLLEVSYWDDIAFMQSNNINVEFNLSRDYQSFLLWWAPTDNSLVNNNTIIRDDNEVTGNWNAVNILDAPPGNLEFTKNIIVVDNDQTESIFIQGFDGAVNDVVHTHNCYWNVENGSIDLGLPAGSNEIFVDPLFIDYENSNYYLNPASPAVGWGAFGTMSIDADGDGFDSTVDCDDTDPNINPNAEDIPNNGIDEDCDGSDLVTSTYEFANSTINIYPNPAIDVINVDIKGQLNFRVNLYNLEGKLIESKVNSHQIKVDSTPEGVYLLEIKDLEKNRTIVEKIIIGK